MTRENKHDMQEDDTSIVPTRTAAGILGSAGIDERFLIRLVEKRIINPSFGGVGRQHLRDWSPDDIFKAFACKVMLDEYREKYPGNKSKNGMDLKYVSSYVPNLKLGRYKEFTSRKDWEEITKAAAEAGVDFSKTIYAFTPLSD